MTDMEKMKLLTGESDEELLSLLLEDAEAYVLAYTGRSNIPEQLEKTVRDLAVVAYNRIGTEGETGRSEGGESYSFDSAPKNIYDIMDRYRLVRCGGYAYEKK
ncbi:phage head-tail connector protein [Murimonas intestini]|uniref:phage head-tail connector protein n=1 Tax=Murimonas intestini TaxID=1337051 RepID=UPI00248C7E76|nr:phage head-tail connector protein [Murimonas intestini]